MEQSLNIIKIVESWDMSLCNRTRHYAKIDAAEIVEGAQFEVFDTPLRVVSADDTKVELSYHNATIVLDRDGQVLGTPAYGIPNEHLSITERYILFFESNEATKEGATDALIEAFNRMFANANEGNFWKNIALGRECLRLMKHCISFNDAEFLPELRLLICQRVIDEDMIEITETPRLFQSFCEYYRHMLEFVDFDVCDKEIGQDLQRRFFTQVDEYRDKLCWIVEEAPGDYAKELWQGLGGVLKKDTVQMSRKYEEVIYEVECELDDMFKDELRGMGFCHAYWSAKRAALAHRGIEWRSPSAMNPRVMFD